MKTTLFKQIKPVSWVLWGCSLSLLIFLLKTEQVSTAFRVTSQSLDWQLENDSSISSTFLQSQTPFSHAPFLVELPSKNLFCCWFGGSREGGKDVAIYGSTFDYQYKIWSIPKPISTIPKTEQATNSYIRSLGNSVLGVDSENRLIMWYTSKIGGWSTSSINTMYSTDEGLTWSSPKRMTNSPFFNMSSLVKGPPIPTENNGWILPIYHECLSKYGALLFLDDKQIVHNQINLSIGREAIQPIALLTNNSEISVWMRNCHHGPIITAKHDILSGLTTRGYSQIQNPDKAMAIINLPDDSKLMVANNKTTKSLYLFHMGKTDVDWNPIISLESIEYGNDDSIQNYSSIIDLSTDIISEWRPREFVYPSMIRTDSGEIHISYSWGCRRIRHLQLSDQWLYQLLEESQS